ncbi:MAG: hypothetical protein KH135_02940 [Firmicutes bacterium]|nr:hypothetical protein [Bacillota bacterium]
MIDKLKGKYVFFDVDGTLSEYRFQDKVYASRNPEYGCQTLENFLFDDLFLEARPLKTMQNIVSSLDNNQIFVLGAAVTNHEIEQKYQWLEKYYPQFQREHIIFITSTMLKPEVMIEYAKRYQIHLDDIVFVDDRLDVLRKAEEMGITSYHPSSFME